MSPTVCNRVVARAYNPFVPFFAKLYLQKLARLAELCRKLPCSHLLAFLLSKGKPSKQSLPSFAGLTCILALP